MPPPAGPYRYRRFRRWMSVNVALALGLAAAAAVLANVLTARLDLAWTLPRSRADGISPGLRALVDRLEAPLDVVLLTARQPRLHGPLRELAEAMAAASPRVRVEDLDPFRDVRRVEDLVQRFGLDEGHAGLLLYRDRAIPLTDRELVDLPADPEGAGSDPRFRGEEALAIHLLALVEPRRPVVYFLQGHGELDPESFDAVRGASRLAQAMRRERLEVRRLDLREAGGVPEDAECVVIAGPKERITAAETDLLRRYLGRNGRMLVLLDAGGDTGLDAWLAEWGVLLEQGWVVDPQRAFVESEVVVRTYAPHPITEGLSGTTTVLVRPRTVRVGESAETPGLDPSDGMVLLNSSPESWLEKDPQARPARLEPERGDVPGPLPLAVALQRGARQVVDTRFPSSRLVVIGSAEFVSNQGMARGGAGNSRLVLRAVNWLLERAPGLDLAPRPMVADRITLTREDRERLFVSVFVVMPGTLLGLGLLVWARRKF